jgi:hypothetical protein
MYLAVLPPSRGDRRALVQVRRADVIDDSPPEMSTDTYEVWLTDGQLQVGTMENGSMIYREVLASFTGDEDEECVIDFIVRIDKHIIPSLAEPNG